MSRIEKQDAGFFSMLHEKKLLDFPIDMSVDDDERRQRSRRSFPTVQSIAPYATALPPREKFREVRCHDLSTNGIAFFADGPVDYDRLVVALAGPNDVIYLTAAVAHQKQIGEPGSDESYLIGCRFLGRVQID